MHFPMFNVVNLSTKTRLGNINLVTWGRIRITSYFHHSKLNFWHVFKSIQLSNHRLHDKWRYRQCYCSSDTIKLNIYIHLQLACFVANLQLIIRSNYCMVRKKYALKSTHFRTSWVADINQNGNAAFNWKLQNSSPD